MGVGVVGSIPQKNLKKYFTQIGIPAKNGGGGGVRGVYVPVVTTISTSSF
jgi:glutaminase